MRDRPTGPRRHDHVKDWVKDQTHLTGSVRYVLHLLADRLGDNEYVWPSLGRLARDGGISRSTVQDCVAYLTYAEAIDVEPRHRADGSRSSNRYRLNVHLGVVQPRLSYTEWRAVQRTWCSSGPVGRGATPPPAHDEPRTGPEVDLARTDHRPAEPPRNSQDEQEGKQVRESVQNVNDTGQMVRRSERSPSGLDDLGAEGGEGIPEVELDREAPWLTQHGYGIRLAPALETVFRHFELLEGLRQEIETACRMGAPLDVIEEAMKSANGIDWSTDEVPFGPADCREMIRLIRLI